MAITTFAELKTAAANWLARSDLTALIPDFITLCETDFNRRLRIRAMETETISAITTASGIVTAALPDGWLEGRVLWFDGTTPKRIIRYEAPAQFRTMYQQNTNAQPTVFTIAGDNAEFRPVPDAAYSIAALYYKRIPALSDAATTNWMITNAPDVYLFGTLKQAMPYIRNDARMMLWNNEYEKALAGLERADSRDRHSGGPLTIQTDTGNP